MNRSLSLDEWKSILQYTKMPHKYTSVASTLTPYHKELREQLNKRLKWYKHRYIQILFKYGCPK